MSSDPAPASSRRRCAVASPHVAATEAASRCVERGGNALDAALAAAFALTVVYPHNTSLGGDLFALVHHPDGGVTAVNASGPAARHVDVAAVAGRHGGTMPVRGIDTVTLPGAVAGLGAVHALGALLPWSAHVEAARDLAEHGVSVAAGLERAIDRERELIGADRGLSALLGPAGHPLRRGELLVQPHLALTLGRIADAGPDEFYSGALAHELANGLRTFGSALDEEDFAAFEPLLDGGLTRTVRGREVWTAGPNSQGFLLLEILQALDILNCDDPLGADAGALAQLFGLASRDRDDALADPGAMAESVDELLEVGRWAALLDEVASPRASDGYVPPAGAASTSTGDTPGVVGRPGGDTVAVVAADSDGWGVSLIQSLFYSFGSGILHEPTGVIFHDRGALFSLETRSPNVLAPGKRPAHTLMPVLVREGGKLRFVAGTMGGRAQPQIHAQVLLGLFAGEEAVAAVASPRWIVERSGGSGVALVERGVPATAKAALQTLMPVLGLGDLDAAVGHAQVAGIDHEHGGMLSAGSDPRADGSAAVVTGR